MRELHLRVENRPSRKVLIVVRLKKLEPLRHTFVKFSFIKYHENPFRDSYGCSIRTE
jgi:hypothetical protein